MPNIKEIKIHKDNRQAAPFLTLSVSTIIDTYKKLKNPEAFYLYICLCGHTNNFDITGSAETLSAKFGQPASVIEDSFNQLINTGILIPRKGNSTLYDFYASTQKSNPNPNAMIYWGE